MTTKQKIKFYTKNFPNFIVRLCTKDKFYICEECNKIHRRNGKECYLDDKVFGSFWKTFKSGNLWYRSVDQKCYKKVLTQARMALNRAALQHIREGANDDSLLYQD